MADPTLRIIGDSSKAQQAVTALEKKVDKLESKLKRQGQTSKKGADQTATAIQGIGRETLRTIGMLAGIATPIGVALSVAQRLRAELANIHEVQRQAGQAQISLAGAQRTAFRNLGDDPTLSRERLNQIVTNLAEETGAKKKTLFEAASMIFSTKGRDISGGVAIEALGPAARLNAGDPQALQAEAGAILSLLTRAKPGTTAEDITGFLMSTGIASNVADPELFSRNVAPAIARQTAFGDTFRESGAMMAAITQSVNDFEGRISANALTNFSKQLMLVTAGIEGLGAGEGSTMKRLQFLRGDDPRAKEIREALIGPLLAESSQKEKFGLKGEAKAFTTLAGFLDPNANKAFTLLEASFRDLPNAADADVVFHKFVQSMQSEPIQVSAKLDRILAAAEEELKLVNITGGRAGIARDRFEGLLKAANLSFTEQQLEKFGFDISTEFGSVAPVETVAHRLRRQVEGMRHPQDIVFDASRPGRNMRIVNQPLTPEAERQAEVLERIADKLDTLIATEKDAGRRQRPAPNPNAQREPARR